MTDETPCPEGFFCVNGLCQDHPGASSDVDLATGGNGGGGGGGTAGGGGGGGGGLSTDMAHAPFDLATSAPDMAGGACGMQGDVCNDDSDCCNMICFPGPGLCLF